MYNSESEDKIVELKIYSQETLSSNVRYLLYFIKIDLYINYIQK